MLWVRVPLQVQVGRCRWCCGALSSAGNQVRIELGRDFEWFYAYVGGGMFCKNNATSASFGPLLIRRGIVD